MSSLDLGHDRIILGSSGAGWLRAAALLGVVGLAAAVGLGASGGEDGWKHFHHAFLTSYAFFLSISLGGLFFVLVSHLTRAGWSVVVRRCGEMVASTLPLMVLGAVVVFAGRHFLYEWTHAEAVAQDHILHGKAAYLNTPFFAIRLVVYFLVWVGLSWFFLSRSRRQDESGDPGLTRSMEKLSAPGMILFALTVTLASFDLLMSLEPHWFSTIFGVYYFAGCVLGFLCFFVLFLYLVQRTGALTRLVTREHFHDLGKLVFAFVVFWAYIAFSQFMLIWYGNLPEETFWYLERQTGDWTAVSLVLLFGHFVVPFLFLMSKHPKRGKAALGIACVWLLVMHWLDMYWLVMPGAYPGEFPFGLIEVAAFVGLGGLFVAAVLWRARGKNLVPVKDPRLEEALHFENA